MCQENKNDKDVQVLINIEKSIPKGSKEGCKGNCNHEGVDIEAQKELCHGEKKKKTNNV